MWKEIFVLLLDNYDKSIYQFEIALSAFYLKYNMTDSGYCARSTITDCLGEGPAFMAIQIEKKIREKCTIAEQHALNQWFSLR